MLSKKTLRLELLEDRMLLAAGVGDAEQFFVYALNRARHDPVAYQLEQDLPVDLAYVTPRAPLAVNDQLYASAEFHAAEMASYNYFDHQSQVTGDWPNKMARDQGYQLPAWWTSDTNYIESIAAGYPTVMESLNGLIVDEGVPLLGHRVHLLSTDEFTVDDRQIGVGHAYNQSTVYRDYWAIHITREDPSETFLTGVVFDDLNGNDRYDQGEGLSGVEVTVGDGPTITNAAGGWALRLAPGAYTVTASGGSLSGTSTAAVTITTENIEVDFLSGQNWGIVNFDTSPRPVAVDDLSTAMMNTTLSVSAGSGVLANDTNPQGGTLSAVLVQDVAHGTLRLAADGSFTYAPEANFHGTDTFTYTATDGQGTSNVANATIRVAQPLGTVDFHAIAGLNLSANDLWYRVQTTRQGLFTLDATADTAQLSLHDSQGDDLANARQRIDWQADGIQTFYFSISGTGTVDLRLANLVQRDQAGSITTVYGTAGDDTFEVRAGATCVVTVNSVRYESPQAALLNIFGNGGQDTATLYDSAGDDRFVGWAGGGSLTTGGSTNTVSDIDVVIAYANAGGNDEAKLYDSPGDDTFVGTSNYGGMIGAGFAVHTQGFDRVHAFATAGGNDRAKLYDSAGDDTFYATPVEAAMFGNGFYNRAKFFESVHAYATAGGDDAAHLYDSAGNDTFYGTPIEGGMIGAGFFNRAKGFENVHGYSDQGGYDVAKLYDSPGDDTFVATPTYGALSGAGFHHRAHRFDAVHAYGTSAGYDVAKMYDSPGDDLFYGDAREGALFLPGQYYNRAKYFEAVHAFATAGGDDRAELYDSAGDDTFVSNDVEGAIFGAAFYHRVKHFEQVFAHAVAGGTDQAYLRDSSSVDQLTAQGSRARLSNAALDFLFEVEGFSRVEATATTQGDTKSVIGSLDFQLDLVGPWQDSQA